MSALQFARGNPLVLGATVTSDGVNFAIYSKDATSVSIDFFTKGTDKKAFATYTFNPATDKFGAVWCVKVLGLGAGALYLYRVAGPFEPEKGLRFNENAMLFDPYAKAFTTGSAFLSYKRLIDDGLATIQNGKLLDLSTYPKCVVVDDEAFDWEGDAPLNIPIGQCIIYEAHLKGYTQSPSSAVRCPGTFSGLIEKIPYLQKLGITSVELLPIFEFDENENININPKTGERLKNFWGYSTIGFFAPKTSYTSRESLATNGGSVTEFKAMVKAFHKAGIEIILDIVFNHTAEGNEHGLTLNFRGLANDDYYMLTRDKRYYQNYSGCGNSFNTLNPVTAKFVLDCLRYWVVNMHVDGFRFDLATSLCRDEDGSVLMGGFLTKAITADPVLQATKMIAEPWDCGGCYLVGNFPGRNWSEWNDRYRNDIRRFVRGDEGVVTSAATRIAGSSDIYNHEGKSTTSSVNFITCHDGFTLNDLVSFNGKHNEQNGEDNRDGTNDNNCYNNGYEGITINPRIESVRIRKVKNALLCLLVSQGVPLICAGDEFRRTQEGNNNAYCQDNEVSYVNWNLQKRYQTLVDFTSVLTALRRAHQVFRREHFFTTSRPEVEWYDFNGKALEWNKIKRFLAFMLYGAAYPDQNGKGDNDFYVALNQDIYDITMTLPTPPQGGKWHLVCDTSIEDKGDEKQQCAFKAGEEELLIEQRRYIIPAGSSVILIAK